MFFKQRSNIMFRNYGTFGYITDDRNFSYIPHTDISDYIGDKIISESGVVFFAVLKCKPQHIDVLVKKIQEQFTDINTQTIKTDAIEFYCLLEQDGFITSGKTLQECEEKDIRFSYRELSSISNKTLPTKSSSLLNTQDFFAEYFRGKPQLSALHIEITSQCNERCIHCYIPHENKVSAISSDLFYKILQQCNDMKVLHLTLSGGEPMLHENFCDFLEKCDEYNLSLSILSNLTLLNDKILSAMKKHALLGVQVSLYSMDPLIHDKITKVKGSFEKTKSGILKLIENDIPVQISCPIMKLNKECYGNILRWAHKYNISVNADPVIIAKYNHSTQNLNCRLSICEIESMINNKIDDNPKYLDQLENKVEASNNISSDDFICSVCSSSICISDNGNVYPCAGWQGYVVGNVKTESLSHIWNNSNKVKYLRGLRNKDLPKCIHCPARSFCNMCMVRNANENATGDPLVVNEYFCQIAKLKKEIAYKRKCKA